MSRPATVLLTLLLHQFKRDRIDAVPLVCRGGAIVEHVAEVGITRAAQHFYSPHAMPVIGFRRDILEPDGGPETWPPGPGVEFGLRAEQFVVTTHAVVNAVLLAPVVFP